MRTAALSAWLLASSVVLFAKCPDAQKQCWVIIGIVGKWESGGMPLSYETGLNPGTNYMRDPATARSGSITLAWDAAHKETHSCDDPGSCAKPFTVPPAPKEQSFWQAFIAFNNHPQRFVAPVSRDYGSLHDAVVPLNGNSAEFATVFADLGKGDYWFKIDRLQPGSDQVAPIGQGPIMISWDPNRKPSGALALGPGLYRIQITNAQGEATGSDAWALVCRPQDYVRARAAFDELARQTASWHEDVPASGIHAIYRAELEILAQ